MSKSFEPRDVTAAFAGCGIRPGEVLVLHADALGAAQLSRGTLEEKMEGLVDAILELLGPGGTLVMPTFTYSATRGERFDPAESPSAVGRLTEHFRRRTGVLRTRHPVFSFAALGPLAEELAGCTLEDCFGPGTAFDLLALRDAWWVCVACSFDRVTFVHYLEQSVGVDYRYFKEFPYRVGTAEGSEVGTVRYYVRDLERPTGTRLDALKAALLEEGTMASLPFGRARLEAVRSRDFLAAGRRLLALCPTGLIEEGQAGGPT